MIDKPTVLERVSGSPITEAAATLVAGAGVAFTPLAPLLPVLSNCLAARRHQGRVESAIKDISEVLARHEGELQRLTDPQYHLLTEAVSEVFQTVHQEKIVYLQRAIRNSLNIDGLVPQESVVLARFVREISAEEADFVVSNFSFRYIHVSDLPSDRDDLLRVPRGSRESLIVAGLESIGVLEFALGTAGGGNMLSFSDLTAKLLLLLRE